VFWTTTQLLTVSSQLKNPISRRSAFVVDLLAALLKEAPDRTGERRDHLIA
jgi:hypothetical protein